jgi:hypothetical protein
LIAAQLQHRLATVLHTTAPHFSANLRHVLVDGVIGAIDPLSRLAHKSAVRFANEVFDPV